MNRLLNLSLALLAASCGGGESLGPITTPVLDPANFSTPVKNPFFPLTPGTTYHFEGVSEDGPETNTVEVTGETKMILGITTTVVHDQVFVGGELREDTFDWFAADDDGNVWYLGEDSREVRNGQVVGTGGSWEAGVNGAQAGIIMWADPGAHVGEQYRQEFAKGVAEDLGKVVALDQSVVVPYGSFSGCLKTEDRDALDPGTVENKYYCPNAGLVRELTVQGASERNELVGITGPTP